MSSSDVKPHYSTSDYPSANPGLLAVAIIAIVVQLTFWYGRIHYKVSHRILGWDDALLTLGVICCLAVDGVCLYTVHEGFGNHMTGITPAKLLNVFKAAPGESFVQFFAFGIIKTSIGLTLMKIGFGKVFNRIVLFFVVLQAAANLMDAIETSISCIPWQRQWDKTVRT